MKSATSQEELKKFQQTVALFRQYSARYDMDYLLVMAQAYQESQLNQQAKSHVGAVGIMQLMPATGKDMGVGDIHELEPNIHAGVKYIRFMIDRYYAKEPMDRLNKGLFAFASYNAGPGRVQQLREAAKKRGLDPNVWFDNVELIAAEKIGRETVQYVSNIYKYYVAYTLIIEDEEARRKAMGRAREEGVVSPGPRASRLRAAAHAGPDRRLRPDLQADRRARASAAGTCRVPCAGRSGSSSPAIAARSSASAIVCRQARAPCCSSPPWASAWRSRSRCSSARGIGRSHRLVAAGLIVGGGARQPRRPDRPRPGDRLPGAAAGPAPYGDLQPGRRLHRRRERLAAPAGGDRSTLEGQDGPLAASFDRRRCT